MTLRRFLLHAQSTIADGGIAISSATMATMTSGFRAIVGFALVGAGFLGVRLGGVVSEELCKGIPFWM